MPNYRRSRVAGGCYFFTIHLLERHDNCLLVEHIGLLREVVKRVRLRYPFHIDGCVILPEHIYIKGSIKGSIIKGSNIITTFIILIRSYDT